MRDEKPHFSFSPTALRAAPVPLCESSLSRYVSLCTRPLSDHDLALDKPGQACRLAPRRKLCIMKGKSTFVDANVEKNAKFSSGRSPSFSLSLFVHSHSRSQVTTETSPVGLEIVLQCWLLQETRRKKKKHRSDQTAMNSSNSDPSSHRLISSSSS